MPGSDAAGIQGMHVGTTYDIPPSTGLEVLALKVLARSWHALEGTDSSAMTVADARGARKDHEAVGVVRRGSVLLDVVEHHA